jgi:dTDP-4-dehydrorhamnose reductase
MIGPLLIFGAAGQVGQEVVNSARERGFAVFGANHNNADITDADAVARLVDQQRPGLIVNAAAYTSVDKAESEPDLAFWINAHGAETVARVAARTAVPLIHISTDYVFDGRKVGPYTEADSIAPLGTYGRSKADGERRVSDVFPQAIIMRTAWLYGAYGKNFLKTILALSTTSDCLRVVSDQRGCPTATADIAEAIFAVNSQPEIATKGGLFHFAGEGTTTWHGFAQAIIDAQAKSTVKRPLVDEISSRDWPTAAKRPMNSTLNSQLFAKTFGYKARPWTERVYNTVTSLLGEPASKPRM